MYALSVLDVVASTYHVDVSTYHVGALVVRNILVTPDNHDILLSVTTIHYPSSDSIRKDVIGRMSKSVDSDTIARYRAIYAHRVAHAVGTSIQDRRAAWRTEVK